MRKEYFLNARQNEVRRNDCVKSYVCRVCGARKPRSVIADFPSFELSRDCTMTDGQMNGQTSSVEILTFVETRGKTFLFFSSSFFSFFVFFFILFGTSETRETRLKATGSVTRLH